MPTDQLSRTFAALADPTRRAMLARLSRGEATVGQLAEPFALTFAAVSKHLRVLQDAGLVSRGRDAQYRPARLDARPLAAASDWIGDYQAFWSDSFDSLGSYLDRLQSSSVSGAPPGAAVAEPAGVAEPTEPRPNNPTNRNNPTNPTNGDLS